MSGGAASGVDDDQPPLAPWQRLPRTQCQSHAVQSVKGCGHGTLAPLILRPRAGTRRIAQRQRVWGQRCTGSDAQAAMHRAGACVARHQRSSARHQEVRSSQRDMRNDAAPACHAQRYGSAPQADNARPADSNEGDIAQLPPPVCTALAAVLLRILHTRRLSKAQERARKGAWVWVAKERNRCTKEHTRSRSSNPAQDAALEASSQRAMLLPFPRGSRSTRCSAAGVSTSVAAAEWPAAPSPPRNG